MRAQFGVTELFYVILSKPGYVLDDKGWGWIQYTHVIRSFSEAPEEDGVSHEQNP